MVKDRELAPNEFLVVKSYNGYGIGPYYFRNFKEFNEHFFDVLLDRWFHWKDKRIIWDSDSVTEDSFKVDGYHFFITVESFGVF